MEELKRSLIFSLTLILLSVCSLRIQGETLHWNEGRGYHGFKYGGRNGLYIDNKTDTLQYDYFSLNTLSKDFSLKFRAKNLHGHPSKKYQYFSGKGKIMSLGNPHWGFFITGDRDTVAVTVKGGEIMTAGEPLPSLEIALYNVKQSRKETISLTKNINPYDGDNLWRVELAEGKIMISAGDHNLNEIVSGNFSGEISGFGFLAGWGDELLVSDISVEYSGNKEFDGKLTFDLMNLDERFQNNDDPLEGYWTLFDRELEESLIKMGGNYNLACIREGENYLFYYLQGATVNAKEWERGDLKAILSPTPFEGIFDVEWLDAMKEPMNNEIKAQRGEGNTLSIQFPYQSSKLRLRKMSSGVSAIKEPAVSTISR